MATKGLVVSSDETEKPRFEVRVHGFGIRRKFVVVDAADVVVAEFKTLKAASAWLRSHGVVEGSHARG
jgi:hypothetical protein